MYADLAQRLPSNTRHWQSEEFLAELTDWVVAEAGPVRSLESTKLRGVLKELLAVRKALDAAHTAP